VKKTGKKNQKARLKKQAGFLEKTSESADGFNFPSEIIGKHTPVYEVRELGNPPHHSAQAGTLLSQTRMQWQFGDWDSLCRMDLLQIEHHTDRAELALLAGCAAFQKGQSSEGRQYMSAALGWGCDRMQAIQLLVSGVHNTLAKYHSLKGRNEKASALFDLACIGLGGDRKLIAKARQSSELEVIGLNSAKPTEEEHPTSQVNATLNDVQLEKSVEEKSSIKAAVEQAALLGSPYKPGITSYAQNFEDVILWRSLGEVEHGFYIDIGAQHPVTHSVSKVFYEKGWRGIHVEATASYAKLLREDRPDEIVIEAAISDRHGSMPFYEIPDTGISTGDRDIAEMNRKMGFDYQVITVPQVTLTDIFALAGERDIHWLKIDVEGMERNVLEGWGGATQRPWIIVVESTLPNSCVEIYSEWENLLLCRGYEFVYSDGLSRFYLSKNHAEMRKNFSFPPNPFDSYKMNHG
jgi:FkbM family methyltransferase